MIYIVLLTCTRWVTKNHQDGVLHTIVSIQNPSTVLSPLNKSLAQLKTAVQALDKIEVVTEELSVIKSSVENTLSRADKFKTPPNSVSSTPQEDPEKNIWLIVMPE